MIRGETGKLERRSTGGSEVVLRKKGTGGRGPVYAHDGHKDSRGYLGVDSNDGARGAPRQISLPIAAKVGI